MIFLAGAGVPIPSDDLLRLPPVGRGVAGCRTGAAAAPEVTVKFETDLRHASLSGVVGNIKFINNIIL